MRYFLYLSYDGTAYHGWQKQPNALGVQQVLEEKLSLFLRNEIEVVASGRTDMGVHAREQVVHFDFPEKLNREQFIYKVNKLLPSDIAVYNLREVSDEAHARFDAISRSYEYHISFQKNPFLAGKNYLFSRNVNVELMNQAAAILLKHQDFESFSKVKTDVYTFNCDVFEAQWKQLNENLVFHVNANRFLRGMVRALVGTLLDVGMGKISPDEFEKIIQSKNRQKAGRAVPPEGLYLTNINYPERLFKD